MYTKSKERAQAHEILSVMFGDIIAPEILACHNVKVTFQISCLLRIHSTTLSGVELKLYDI